MFKSTHFAIAGLSSLVVIIALVVLGQGAFVNPSGTSQLAAPIEALPTEEEAVLVTNPEEYLAPDTPAVGANTGGGGGGGDSGSAKVTTNTGVNSTLPAGSSAGASFYNFGTTTLRNGSKGEAVKELQRFLNAKLNLGLVVDGVLGPKTIEVIKKWQSDNGLVPDGLIGPATKARMLSY